MIQFGVSLMTEREILREGSLRKINTFGKNRRVICLTTDEQVNGIHHREDTVHIVVHIDATTGITVVGRQGVVGLTEHGRLGASEEEIPFLE